MPPTPRQLEILTFVARHIHVRGYPPTLQEVASAFGFASTNGVTDHYKYLRNKGFLRLGEAGKFAPSRAVWPTAEGWALTNYMPPVGPNRPASTARVVAINTGWRCATCSALTFDASKPCPMCAADKLERRSA